MNKTINKNESHTSKSKYELKNKEVRNGEFNTQMVSARNIIHLNSWRTKKVNMGVSKYRFECAGGIGSGAATM